MQSEYYICVCFPIFFFILDTASNELCITGSSITFLIYILVAKKFSQYEIIPFSRDVLVLLMVLILMHLYLMMPFISTVITKEGYHRMYQLLALLMWFCYILSGWKGSATARCIFDDACQKDFAIPHGSFYLADTGLMICNALFIPYWGTCYHLKEWGRASEKDYCNRTRRVGLLLQRCGSGKCRCSELLLRFFWGWFL